MVAASGLLFSEDLLYVANFLLNLAGYLFAGAAIPQVGIANGFSALLFNFALGFANSAFDFVFCARPHENHSRAARSLRGFLSRVVSIPVAASLCRGVLRRPISDFIPSMEMLRKHR